MTSEELFQSAGFVGDYYSRMCDFYKNNFASEEEMIDFFVRVFKNDETNNTPRRMMNQVQQLVSIATDISQIRPGRDPLQIFFIKTCLESLFKLSEIPKNQKGLFYKKFAAQMSDEAKNYILTNFLIIDFEDEYMRQQFAATHDLTIDDFFEIIKATRDIVAHEGNYWEMQFFAPDDSTWISSLETDREILKSYKYKCKKMMRSYGFRTTLVYDKFIHFFIETCIAYINTYIDEQNVE